jgi:hypothetical protein
MPQALRVRRYVEVAARACTSGKSGLDIGCSDYITEGIRTRFPTIAARCHNVYNGVDTDRFCPMQDFHSQSDGSENLDSRKLSTYR